MKYKTLDELPKTKNTKIKRNLTFKVDPDLYNLYMNLKNNNIDATQLATEAIESWLLSAKALTQIQK